MAVEKISQQRQTFRKNKVFHLSHGTKNIHRNITYTMEEDFLQLLLLKVIVSRLDSDRLKNLNCTLVCTNFLLLLQTREDQKTLFMRSRVNFLHVGI